MSELDDIYGNRILELASAMSGQNPLLHPDATASAHSKLCGSTIDVAVTVDGDRVTGFFQDVRACLLGQASASVVGREIIGSTMQDIRDVGEQMRRMLKEDGPKPQGRWADLGILEPVKDYKGRHTSTLLIFEALGKAFDEVEAASADSATLEKQELAS